MLILMFCYLYNQQQLVELFLFIYQEGFLRLIKFIRQRFYKTKLNMQNYQSRSQLIRTSLSGNRKSQLTYNKLPVSVQRINMYKKQLIRNTKTSFLRQKQHAQPTFIKSPFYKFNQQLIREQHYNSRNSNNNNKRTIDAKINNRFNQTQASTFNRATGISNRAKSSQEKFRTTSKTAFLLQNGKMNENIDDSKIQRYHQQQDNQQDNYHQRPSTQYPTYRQKINVNVLHVYSPLDVVNSKLQSDNNSSFRTVNTAQLTNKTRRSERFCQSALSKRLKSTNHIYRSQSSSLLSKNPSNYLKKGSSIDRSMLINLLKSKYKQNLSITRSNYSNAKSNQKLYEAIKHQIPNQFRDIIGGQQMLKMSKVMTGINIKTVNMEDKIQKAISNRIVQYKIKTGQSNVDDHQTLKSIKRW